MSDFLTDGVTSLSLEFDWESSRNAENVLNASRALGGRESKHLWANVKAFNLPLSAVPSSDAALINEWWRATTAVTLYFDATSYSCYITGGQPFTKMMKPYQDRWDGTIQIERI